MSEISQQAREAAERILQELGCSVQRFHSVMPHIQSAIDQSTAELRAERDELEARMARIVELAWTTKRAPDRMAVATITNQEGHDEVRDKAFRDNPTLGADL